MNVHQHSPQPVEIPQDFKAIMRSLSANITNLQGQNRARADGILKNIERYGNVTVAQRNEVIRLDKMAKKPFRERRPKFHASGVGNMHVSAKEAEKRWEKQQRHKKLYATDPEYRAEFDRTEARGHAFSRIILQSIGESWPKDRIEVELTRNHIRFYRREVDLLKALPREIVTPHVIPRRQLIDLLAARLRTLRAEGLPARIGGCHDWAAAKARIRETRAALIAEYIAFRADRSTARNLARELEAEGYSCLSIG